MNNGRRSSLSSLSLKKFGDKNKDLGVMTPKSYFCVPGMALIQSESNRPQAVTAKCSEPQASISDDMGEGSGVAIPLCVRTGT
jgi:hypothetical protein